MTNTDTQIFNPNGRATSVGFFKTPATPEIMYSADVKFLLS